MIKNYEPAGIRSNIVKLFRKLIKGGARVLVAHTDHGKIYVMSGYAAICIPETAYYHVVSGMHTDFASMPSEGIGIKIEHGKTSVVSASEVAYMFEKLWDENGIRRAYPTPYRKDEYRIVSVQGNTKYEPSRPMFVDDELLKCFSPEKWSWYSKHPYSPLMGIECKQYSRALIMPVLGRIQPTPIEEMIANEYEKEQQK